MKKEQNERTRKREKMVLEARLADMEEDENRLQEERRNATSQNTVHSILDTMEMMSIHAETLHEELEKLNDVTYDLGDLNMYIDDLEKRREKRKLQFSELKEEVIIQEGQIDDQSLIKAERIKAFERWMDTKSELDEVKKQSHILTTNLRCLRVLKSKMIKEVQAGDRKENTND